MRPSTAVVTFAGNSSHAKGQRMVPFRPRAAGGAARDDAGFRRRHRNGDRRGRSLARDDHRRQHATLARLGDCREAQASFAGRFRREAHCREQSALRVGADNVPPAGHIPPFAGDAGGGRQAVERFRLDTRAPASRRVIRFFREENAPTGQPRAWCRPPTQSRTRRTRRAARCRWRERQAKPSRASGQCTSIGCAPALNAIATRSAARVPAGSA